MPRLARILIVVGCVVAVITAEPAVAAAPSSQPRPTAVGGASYALPLAGAAPVLRPFEAPPTPYAAGHRGVDLGTSTGSTVRAAGAGRVSFAGQVAGRGLVVIIHADGISTEYEPVTPLVHRGDQVERGAAIGRISGAHDDCPVGTCLHWGARRAGRYFDPLSLLHALGVVHLVPLA